MRETYGGGGDSLGSILQSSQIEVGENVEKNDLLYLCGLSGKGFKAKVTDYEAVGALAYGTAQTNAASGQIVAQTSLVANITEFNPGGSPVLAKSDGTIFVAAGRTGGVGVRLSKFSAKGNLIDSVDVVDPGTTKNLSVFELSNGNIAVVYALADIYIAIYDENLTEIKAPTLIASCPLASNYFGATKLAAGGLAIIYQDSASPLLSKIAVFDNAGTLALAAFTVFTRTGTSDKQYHVLKQLSDGNLAFAVSSTNTVSSIGLYCGVYTAAGVQVSAAAQIGTVSVANYPVIATATGYFAVARADGTNQKAWVMNNAGVLQGSGFSAATTGGSVSGVVGNKNALICDGSDFYLVWHRSSDSKCVLTKLPFTGTGYSTAVIATTVTQYNFFVSAFYKDGFIVVASMSGTVSSTAPTLWVIDVSRRTLVDVAGTTFGTAPNVKNGKSISIIDGGDRSFIAVYCYDEPEATNLCVGKWAATTVLGVCVDSSVKNSTVAITSKTGTYEINPINGSRNKYFDMSSNAMIGGKGVIVAGGAVTFV